jgi:hypothetical protein
MSTHYIPRPGVCKRVNPMTYSVYMTNTPMNLISRQAAADRAGVKIRTVDYWRRIGKISTYRDGLNHVRVDPEEIDDLLTAKRETVDAV